VISPVKRHQACLFNKGGGESSTCTPRKASPSFLLLEKKKALLKKAPSEGIEKSENKTSGIYKKKPVGLKKGSAEESYEKKGT